MECSLLKSKGVKLRWITDITKENLHWCKKFMKIVEVRHIDGIKGAFGIHDSSYYLASANVVRRGKIFRRRYNCKWRQGNSPTATTDL